MSFDQKVLPLPSSDEPDENPDAPALHIIRDKVSALYSDEPAAVEEAHEVEAIGAHSKHQKFMLELLASGKDMAVVQTEWHAYYQALSDNEKHEVWQEFYANHARTSKYAAATKPPISTADEGPKVLPQVTEPARIESTPEPEATQPPKKRIPKVQKKTVAELKQQVLKNVQSQGRLQRKHHVQSLLFGLGMGTLVVAFFMFGFFNERIIAPFITPSRVVSNTPIIIDPANATSVGPETKIIIPKINIEVPVVYDVSSIQEKQVQDGLERGVVHYPTTPVPGQNGNVAIVGHSSNNIFNQGRYKFAFVLLNRLEIGDTFMLHYGGTRYVYKIYDKRVVKPTDVAVLGPQTKASTATLITCDPPGTALNRLIVVGEQISPEPGGNIAAAPAAATQTPAIVPGNAESLFQRLFGWL